MRIFVFLLSLIQFFSVNASDIVGSWYGQVDVQGVKLNLSFHIDRQGDVLISTMDSPDQGVIGIATTKTTFIDNKLKITIAKNGIKFKGIMDNNQLTGHFSQFGMSLPLVLNKLAVNVEPDGSVIVNKSEISGSWYGELEIPENPMKIVFHIDKNKQGYLSKMDSPDENITGMKTTGTTFKNNRLKIILKNIDAEYNAAFMEDSLIGTYQQRGAMVTLKMHRKPDQLIIKKKRPQDPVQPLSYASHGVNFSNDEADGITLAGTLTLPEYKDKPPVAILITGSGPQNRNEEVFNHRPFSIWADYLTRHGIAVLRYDDRGVGESEGSQKDATSFDFATDVESAVRFLQSRDDIDINKIGLIGHSEGGLIASMVAARNKGIAFVVLLASTGVSGSEVLYTQSEHILKLAGMDEKVIEVNQKILSQTHQLIKSHQHDPKLKIILQKHFKSVRENFPHVLAAEVTDEQLTTEIQKLVSPWFQYFLNTDPGQFLSQVTSPILAINGSLDVQVNADLNLNGIKNSLFNAGNPDVTIKKLDGLNHQLQTAKTGSILEYHIIEETVSPVVLKLVADWINQRFGRVR